VANAQVTDRPAYTGERMSASFWDIPTRTLLHLIASVGGKDILLTNSVTSHISLKVENVPWDQVLDMVLQIKDLDKRVQDNLIIVGPAAELAEQDAARERASRE
jgi:type IV pilus assembly protein PilQ